MLNIRNQILTFSISNGLVRGLKQLPLYLGAAIFLILRNYSAIDAISELFIYLFAFPRFFSFLLEIMAGAFSYKLGPRGSFISLTIGQVSLALAFLTCFFSFFLSSVSTFLYTNAIAAVLFEIASAMTSGSFEDCYERTLVQQNNKEMIAKVDVLKFIYVRNVQIIFALLGTFACSYYGIYKQPHILMSLFFIGGVISIFCALEHSKWSDWAKNKFHSKENKYTKIMPQLLFFTKSIDTLFIFSTSIIYFIYIKYVTLGPLLSTKFLFDIEKSSLGTPSILAISITSILIPLGGKVGLKCIFKNNQSQILKSFCYKRGLIYIAIWFSFLILASSFFPLSTIMSIVVTFALAAFFAPIYTWIEWLRIYITDNAILKGSPIGDNRSLYYSIISGSREFMIGLFSILYSIQSKKHSIPDIYLLLIFSILSFLLFYSWQKNYTAKEDKEPIY